MATTRKTTKAPAAPAATDTDTVKAVWLITGRGKTARYFAEVCEGAAAAGARVELVAKSGAVTTGTLVARETVKTSTRGNVEGWTFSRDKLTAEQYAAKRILSAQYMAKRAADNAAWQASPEGLVSAARVLARNERLAAERDAAARVPDTKTVTVTYDASIKLDAPAPAAKVAPAADTGRAALIADMKAAGFSLGEIMEFLDPTSWQTTRPAPAATVAVAPAATVKPAAKAPAAKAPATAAKVAPAAPAGITAKCPACQTTGSVAAMVSHPKVTFNGGQPLPVCAPCALLDSATVIARVKRNAAK